MVAVGESAGEPRDRCRLCGQGAVQQRRPDPAITCPVCGQLVADVSNVLLRMPLPEPLVFLLPASVARENQVILFNVDGHEFNIATDLRGGPTPAIIELLDKLRFVLNREICAVHASEAAIRFAIERDYGQENDGGTLL